MKKSSRTTLADVAKEAGVDVSLVSRVLRGHEVKVLDETRQRILDAAANLDYRPNAIARSLQSAKADAFGLVIPNFSNPVYAQIIEGAELAAARRGAVLLTTSGHGWDQGAWFEAIDSGRVDGLLIAGGADIDPSTLKVPHILVNRTLPGAPRSVVLDDEKAARMAAQHLIDLGHRSLVFIGGPDSADTAARRWAGFRASAEEAGATSVRLLPGDYTPQGGRDAVRRALGADLIPTAVVAANLPSAIGALHGLRDEGLDVPGQVSVVAIHDAEIAGFVSPGITTVQMPLRQLGERAIDLLASLPPSAEVAEVVAEPMQVIVRDSSGPAQS